VQDGRVSELEEGTRLTPDFGKLAVVATSGDVLELTEVRVNCEQNSLLHLVRRTTGGACHTLLPSGSSRPGCFYRAIADGKTLRHRTP
jgi:hypothetical protein